MGEEDDATPRENKNVARRADGFTALPQVNFSKTAFASLDILNKAMATLPTYNLDGLANSLKALPELDAFKTIDQHDFTSAASAALDQFTKAIATLPTYNLDGLANSLKALPELDVFKTISQYDFNKIVHTAFDSLTPHLSTIGAFDPETFLTRLDLDEFVADVTDAAIRKAGTDRASLADLPDALRCLIYHLVWLGGTAALFWVLVVGRAVYSDGDSGDRAQAFDGMLAIVVACAAASSGLKKVAAKVTEPEQNDGDS